MIPIYEGQGNTASNIVGRLDLSAESQDMICLDLLQFTPEWTEVNGKRKIVAIRLAGKMEGRI